MSERVEGLRTSPFRAVHAPCTRRPLRPHLSPTARPPLKQAGFPRLCPAATPLTALAQERNRASGYDARVVSEPMFCFETAIKCFYWGCLTYDFDEVRASCCV